MTDQTSGFSGTQIIKKLGIKPDFSVRVVNVPANYWSLLGPLPPNVHVSSEGEMELDFIHIFASTLSGMQESVISLKTNLKKDGMMWISWPKGSSGITTDLNRDIIRAFILQTELVDIKVCAIDETWFGLKFVFRKEFR